MKKFRNGCEVHLHMNNEQNDYRKVNETSFLYICGKKLFIFLYDLGAEKNIPGVYCSPIVYRKIQDGRHFTYLL